jgi:hypothetical protein
VWLDVPEYPGFRVKIWVNMPNRLMDDFKSGNADRAFPAARQIVLEHNNWCDENGEPYPPVSEESFWEAIPDELCKVVLAMVLSAPEQLPNSLRAKRGR